LVPSDLASQVIDLAAFFTKVSIPIADTVTGDGEYSIPNMSVMYAPVLAGTGDGRDSPGRDTEY